MAKDKNREYNASYTVTQRLLPRHHQIQDLVLTGHSREDIAEKVKMSYRQVCNLVNSPNFQHELAIRRSKVEQNVEENVVKSQDEVTEALRAQTISAVTRLTDLITSENEAVARQAANDILDRAGYPKITRTTVDNTHVISIDKETATRIEDALKEIAGTKEEAAK